MNVGKLSGTVGCALAGILVVLLPGLPAFARSDTPPDKAVVNIPAGADLSPVRLRVYSTLGRLVQTLVDEPQGPGHYRVPWTGTNRNGRSVASGVYFYRIEWNGRQETKRMVLVR